MSPRPTYWEECLIRAGQDGQLSQLVDTFNSKYNEHKIFAFLDIRRGTFGQDKLTIRAPNRGIALRARAAFNTSAREGQDLPPVETLLNRPAEQDTESDT